MKTFLLAAVLAAAPGLGCQGASSKPSAGDPAGAPAAPAAPAPAAPAAPAPAAAPAPPSAAPAPAGSAYAADIQKLCDVVARSGAESVPAGERVLPIANWLAANLTTPESRQFLVRIQPLAGEPKAEALEAEARRVGLSGCALAAEWRSPPPP
ncbi:MAG TPA: hypothetical protein VNO30_02940 [Kofleriaceae bacterium]|nr:hypothetical protein [Kofleriaceae bacterium]